MKVLNTKLFAGVIAKSNSVVLPTDERTYIPFTTLKLPWPTSCTGSPPARPWTTVLVTLIVFAGTCTPCIDWVLFELLALIPPPIVLLKGCCTWTPTDLINLFKSKEYTLSKSIISLKSLLRENIYLLSSNVLFSNL